MKIAFFGTPRFAQIVLAKLVDSPFKPTLVVTSPDAKVGRGHKLQTSPVKQTAQKYNIRILQPKNLSAPNFKFAFSKKNDLILNFKFDIAILVAYGKIIPVNILSVPRYGFVNVHPSLLPKYRGPSPIQSAILTGEEKTGVTIMLLDEKVDHGPILAQREVEIEKTDTHESLIEKIGKIGADLLVEVLPPLVSADLVPTPQDHTKAIVTKRVKKADGFVDLANPPDPQTFDRMVRAYYPWPTVWTELKIKNLKLKIKFLPENKIQPEGKKPMSVKEFLNGYPQAKDLAGKLIKP